MSQSVSRSQLNAEHATLTFLTWGSYHRLFNRSLRVEHSLGDGYYCTDLAREEITDDMIARMFTPKIHPNVCTLDEDPGKSAKKKPRPAKASTMDLTQQAHVQMQLPMAQQKAQPVPVVRFQQRNPGIPPFFNQFYGANQLAPAPEPEPNRPQQPKR